MTLFVAHKQGFGSSARTQKIILQLQMENPTHCFIPAAITFEHLYNGDFSHDEIFEIESDLLCNCDQLILISDCSPIMKRQVEFAERIGMEVFDLADEYRTI